MKNKTLKMILSVLMVVLCAFTFTACDASGYGDAIMNAAIEIVKFAGWTFIVTYLIRIIVKW